MQYHFPYIEHIDDVLPVIKDVPEFTVSEKDGYKVILYHVQLADTFPPVWIENNMKNYSPDEPDYVYDYDAAIRRECRGIIFSETGKIIRRPLPKFFNLNEKEETLAYQFNLSELEHRVLTKADGSMLSPFRINGELLWGTKAGVTDTSKPVQAYAESHPEYNRISEYFIDEGWTPIFEWCSPNNRIVLPYEEDELVLLAVRHMNTGEYMSYDDMILHCDYYDIPLIEQHDLWNDIDKITSHTKNLTDTEGFVIRFNNGYSIKTKSDWYVAIHKAKDSILWDRNIVEMILDNTLDDVKAHLPDDDRERLTEFEAKISDTIKLQARYLHLIAIKYTQEMKMDRKTFALGDSKFFKSYDLPIIYSLWEETSYQKAYDNVVKVLRKNIGNNTKYSQIRDAWFPGIQYNEA